MMPRRHRSCFFCHAEHPGVRPCKTCKGVSYCGVECQTSDRPQHKKTCCKPSPSREVQLLFELMMFNLVIPGDDLPARRMAVKDAERLLMQNPDMQSYVDHLSMSQFPPTALNNDTEMGIRRAKLLLMSARNWPLVWDAGPGAHARRTTDMLEYEAVFGPIVEDPPSVARHVRAR